MVFGVRGFPSFFHIKGTEVRKYKLTRKLEVMEEFALEKYKETQPLGMFSSPFGPVGKVKGLLAQLIDVTKQLHRTLTKEAGLSPPTSTAAIIGGGLISLGLFAFLFITCMLQCLEPISQQYSRRQNINRRRREQYAAEQHPHQD